MTPDRAQLWLDEVEAMVRQRHLLTPLQEGELMVNYEAASALLERARLDANRLVVVKGRLVGPA